MSAKEYPVSHGNDHEAGTVNIGSGGRFEIKLNFPYSTKEPSIFFDSLIAQHGSEENLQEVFYLLDWWENHQSFSYEYRNGEGHSYIVGKTGGALIKRDIGFLGFFGSKEDARIGGKTRKACKGFSVIFQEPESKDFLFLYPHKRNLNLIAMRANQVKKFFQDMESQVTWDARMSLESEPNQVFVYDKNGNGVGFRVPRIVKIKLLLTTKESIDLMRDLEGRGYSVSPHEAILWINPWDLFSKGGWRAFFEKNKDLERSICSFKKKIQEEDEYTFQIEMWASLGGEIRHDLTIKKRNGRYISFVYPNAELSRRAQEELKELKELPGLYIWHWD